MGFGVLFIGYIVTYVFSMTNFNIYTDVAGVLIMVYGMYLLSRHNKFLKYAFFASAAMLIWGVVNLVFSLALSEIPQIMDYIKAVTLFTFHLLLLKGICDLAYEVEIPKIVRKSKRNISFTLIYLVAFIFIIIPFPENIASDIATYFKFPVLFLEIIWKVLNGILIYSSYMWICLEGDEDMEIKESRFEIVNKLNTKLSSIEDRAFTKKTRVEPLSGSAQTDNSDKKKKKKKK